MNNLIVIREAQKRDYPELSPCLAEAAQLEWHSGDVIHNMQDDYISEKHKKTCTLVLH